MKIVKKTFPLWIFFILALSIFFRFYNLKDWFFWGMDQEYEAFLAKNIITFKHFPLIGVNASDTGLYLGPIFIYLASIPFAIFGGNPLGWGIVASLMGVLVTYLIYRFGSVMFSQKTGLFASFFYAGSFLFSFYDRQFWNPTPIPLLSLLLGFILFKILNNDKKMLIWTALVFGVAVQCHLSILIFTPLILFIIWKKRGIFTRKMAFLALALFLFIQTPLIIFDLRHDFTNTKAMFKLIRNTNPVVNSTTLYQRAGILLSGLGRSFWMPPPVDLFVESGVCRELGDFKSQANTAGLVTITLAILFFLYWFKTHKKNNHSGFIMTGIFMSTMLLVGLYNRSFFEYYLLFLFPWVAIAIGKNLEFIWQKRHGYFIIFPILFFYLLLNFSTLFRSSTSYSYQEKLEAIRFSKQILGKKSYKLEALGECTRFGGYRYLFEFAYKIPESSYMDSYFSWLYEDKINADTEAKIILLSLIDSRNPLELISKWEIKKLQYLNDYNLAESRKFGKIQVLILSSK